MAKPHRSLLLLALLLLLVSVVFLAAIWWWKGPPESGLFRPTRSSASWSILEEIREMEELETASYDMKLVFPFDFIGEDQVDWAYLKIQYDMNPEIFLDKKNPSWHPGGRVPDAWKYAEIYQLCRQAGLDPGQPDHRFVVISVSVRAGIDLEAWLSGFDSTDTGGEVDGIHVEEEGGFSRLTLMKPPVTVTSFVVEDRDAAADGFPDVPLSPAGWRRLVEALTPELREAALDGGLIEAAETSGLAFLSEIFEASGYDEVVFVDS